jgi:hypothetical protein
MPSSIPDVDEVLKKLASEAVKQGENVRSTVRDITLKALQARGVSLTQIRQVLTTVTAGVSAGAAKSKIDSTQLLADALAGMDDALLKAVEASRIALQSLTDGGVDFNDSRVKRALSELERLEDNFLDTVRGATEGATKQVQGHWASVFQQMPAATGTGAGVEAINQWSEQMRAAVRNQRTANARAIHMVNQSFATLASGVLIGLTEGMRGEGMRAESGKGRKG